MQMIEEAESRFDGDEMQRLLQTINDVLPRPQNSEEDDAAPVDGEEEVLEGADDMEMSEEAAR